MSDDAKGKKPFRQDQPVHPSLHFELSSSQAVCHFTGDWNISAGGDLESVNQTWHSFFEQDLAVKQIKLKVHSQVNWDSRLVAFISAKKKVLLKNGIEVDGDFPEKLNQLIDLRSDQVESTKDSSVSPVSGSFLDWWEPFCNWLSSPFNFLGAWVISLLMLPLLKTQMRIRDLIMECRQCGAAALPIVTLISFLTGLTMAFVGSVQLEKFNAKIYIADLVCLAMVREMGALMVGIIMAGRTGASFAAEIGSMKLNEELDSLRTFGLSPMEFLVLPRTLALLIMTPMLTIYADIVGMLGGLTVGTQIMDFSVSHYIEQTQASISGMWEVFSGLLKSLAFGLIIGLVGCFKGLHTGNSSVSLGRSVTSSVVTAVTLIVITDAVFEIVFSTLELR